MTIWINDMYITWWFYFVTGPWLLYWPKQRQILQKIALIATRLVSPIKYEVIGAGHNMLAKKPFTDKPESHTYMTTMILAKIWPKTFTCRLSFLAKTKQKTLISLVWLSSGYILWKYPLLLYYCKFCAMRFFSSPKFRVRQGYTVATLSALMSRYSVVPTLCMCVRSCYHKMASCWQIEMCNKSRMCILRQIWQPTSISRKNLSTD